MRTKIPMARDRQPGRQSNPNETSELDRGLTEAVKRSNKSLDEKIDRLMREKYRSLNEQNA
jgi:hypothetical protein